MLVQQQRSLCINLVVQIEYQRWRFCCHSDVRHRGNSPQGLISYSKNTFCKILKCIFLCRNEQTCYFILQTSGFYINETFCSHSNGQKRAIYIKYMEPFVQYTQSLHYIFKSPVSPFNIITLPIIYYIVSNQF